MTQILVHMRHIRAARLCADGTRDWFQLHGIDMRRLRQGIPAEELEETGDKLAFDVTRIARAERG